MANVKHYQPLPHCCPQPLFPTCADSQLSHTVGCCTVSCTSPVNGNPSYSLSVSVFWTESFTNQYSKLSVFHTYKCVIPTLHLVIINIKIHRQYGYLGDVSFAEWKTTQLPYQLNCWTVRVHLI